MILEAFLLGISSGSYCIFNCAPVAVPLFLDEKMNRRENWFRLTRFLAGRLVGYLLFGYIVGLTGAYVLGYLDPYFRQKFEAFTMIVLGVILFVSAIEPKKKRGFLCRIKSYKHGKPLETIILGLLTGLSFCPPFFVAAGRVFGKDGSMTGLIYFFFFFLGTAFFLLPLGSFFIFSRFKEAVKYIGKHLRLLIGIYFIIFLGLLNLISPGGA